MMKDVDRLLQAGALSAELEVKANIGQWEDGDVDLVMVICLGLRAVRKATDPNDARRLGRILRTAITFAVGEEIVKRWPPPPKAKA